MSILEFKEISFGDIDIIKKYLDEDDSKCTDYTCGFLLMWGKVLDLQYAISNGMLITKGSFRNGKEMFYMPCGKGDLGAAISHIERYCKERDIPMEFVSIAKPHLEKLTEMYNVDYTESRDYFDYVYSAEKLANLKGKSLHQKRTHISNFKKAFPGYYYVTITDENIKKVKDFYHEYRAALPPRDKSEQIERECAQIALEHMKEMNMFGAFLEIDGKVAAFTIGEQKKDVLYVHVEKADRNYNGSYPVINNEFVKDCLKNRGIRWVNREDDSGEPGLRKAKLSYKPDFLAEKGRVKIKV